MNRIKECRINSNLSQKYVAVALGVAGPSVSNWESGKTLPTPDNLCRLASLFGVTVDYLLGNEEATPAAETKKQPAAQGDELDNRLVSMLVELSPAEVLRVLDFVEGLKAARKVPPSQNP
ncbi:MAG: helix-turn-helix transcriptional regulator [Clostridia bacterium]|nr:helix-turn-helix transcriptional regulator [Clostridia bacterium]